MREPRLRTRMLLAAAALAVPATTAGSIALAGRAHAQVVTAAPPILLGQDIFAPEADPSLVDHIVGEMTYFGFTDYTLSQASIDWGDGVTSAGSTPPAYVTGSHLYREAGNYTVKVTVTATPMKGVTPAVPVILNVSSTAHIREVNVALHGVGSAPNPVMVPGGAYSGRIAAGHDFSQVVSRSDYSAVIDWNDGQVDPVTTVAIAPDTGFNNFVVNSAHTYTTAGLYHVKTTLHDGALTQVAYSWLQVPVVASAVSATEGVAFNGRVGSVTVGNASDVAGVPNVASTTATINWGDGTTSPGTVAKNGTVTGGHTYTDEGTYTITLTSPAVAPAIAIAGPPWSSTAKVTVADSALTATSVASPSVTGTVNKALTATLAHVSDAKPGASLTDLSATIDWGDGSAVGAATLVAGAGGADADGAHTYTTAGVKHGVVHFVDDGGQVAQAPFTVTVTVTVAAPPAGGVLGVTSTPAPTTTASAPVKVPNTGGDLPVTPGLLLIGLGGAMAAVGRRIGRGRRS